MSPRTTALLLAGLLAWSLGAVALADPGLSTGPQIGPVTADEDPAAIGAAALRATGSQDFTVTVYIGNDTAMERTVVAHYDNDDGEFLSASTRTDSRLYGTSAIRWRWTGLDDGWRAGVFAWTPEPMFAHIDRLGDTEANLSVTALNESTLVLAVNNTGTAYALFNGDPNVAEDNPGFHAYAHIRIDRATGHLERATLVTTRPDDDGTRTVERSVYVFTDWGETSVRRPRAIPYTLAELLEDASRVR